MSSQIIPLHSPLWVRSPARRTHPLLGALEETQYGRLTLITPEGSRREFTGRQPGPTAHLKLYEWRVLDELLARGELGFAETYVQGLWRSDHLPDLLTFGLMNSPTLEKFLHGNPWHVLRSRLRGWLQVNSPLGSRRNIMAHYDLGNDFYALWLDESMTYSCALFEGDANRSLKDAQEAKYRRILDRLGAHRGQHILEIGCGWGGFAEAAAQRGMRVTGLTLSKEQADYAKERLNRAGLQSLVSIELIDYRKVTGVFDHVVSIGMFEHVGERYWPAYFNTIKQHLKPEGRALIQSITLDEGLFESLHGDVGFMEQVIFPGGMLPSKSHFRTAAKKAGLEYWDTFSFGKDYVRTTQHWLERFHAHKEEVKALGYDDSFLRLWSFYLSACLAAFASGRTDVMQAELRHAA